MEKQDALAIVLARNAFYKRMHYLALGALTLSYVVTIVLLWMLTILWRKPAEPIYFAADSVGRLIKIIPLTVPNMSLDEVVAWTVDAVQAAFSYNYVNYRSELQNAQRFFTNYGWTNYMKALTASNNLVALTQRRMIVIAQVVGRPKLVTQGILSGAYAWKFEMPLLVTFMTPPFDNKSKYANALTVSVIVQRQPVLQSYRGLGIVQVIASSATAVPSQTPMSATPSS